MTEHMLPPKLQCLDMPWPLWVLPSLAFGLLGLFSPFLAFYLPATLARHHLQHSTCRGLPHTRAHCTPNHFIRARVYRLFFSLFSTLLPHPDYGTLVGSTDCCATLAGGSWDAGLLPQNLSLCWNGRTLVQFSRVPTRVSCWKAQYSSCRLAPPPPSACHTTTPPPHAALPALPGSRMPSGRPVRKEETPRVYTPPCLYLVPVGT